MGDNTLYIVKGQYRIPCSFAYKLACTDDKFSITVILWKRKNVFDNFIE